MITMTMMTSMVSVSMHPLYIAFKLATVVEALVLGSVTIAGLKNKLLVVNSSVVFVTSNFFM